MMVVIVLTDPNGISTTVAGKDSDSSGNLVTGFLYPIDTRWLLHGSYTVVAESADGQHRATADFFVVEPGTENTPAVAATSVVAAAPSATPTAAQPTATLTPVPTATPTATPTQQPTAAPSPQAQNAKAAPAADTQPDVLTAALRFTKDRPGRRQFRVEIKKNDSNNVHQVVAVLAIPPLDEVDDVKLKTRDRIDIKITNGKLEISAPDPQALLDSIQRHGGIKVEHGQLVDYRPTPSHRFRLKFNDGKLEIEASTLRLHVTAVDAAGQIHNFTASPSQSDDKDNRGRNHNGDDDRDDDGDEGD
jgi:hypothetical protein